MALLKENDQKALREEFGALTNRVRIAFFTQALGCETCGITSQILQEITPLSDKLELVTYNYAIDRDAVALYGITRIPAIALLRMEETTGESGEVEAHERDYGIRFYGVPSGYEFMSLIGSILDVSLGDSHLSSATRAQLATLTEPTHFQVFTTPT